MTDLINMSDDFKAGYYAGLDDAAEIFNLIQEIRRATDNEKAED